MSLINYELNEDKKIQLMKDTICKGSTDDEFQLFAYTCKRLGLDPFARQIYPVKRWDSALRREAMTIQTGIDGYRLIADRTGRYSPGKAPVFEYDENKRLICATAFVMKQTPDGKWHEVEASAHYSEYVGMKKDGSPTQMWGSKPHIMLSKCAEALALRKAFPAELSGVYTKEEMDQASNPIVVEQPKECSDQECDQFVEKWIDIYDQEILKEYIQKRSSHFDKSVNETIFILMKDEENFVREINSWIKKNVPDIEVAEQAS